MITKEDLIEGEIYLFENNSYNIIGQYVGFYDDSNNAHKFKVISKGNWNNDIYVLSVDSENTYKYLTKLS